MHHEPAGQPSTLFISCKRSMYLCIRLALGSVFCQPRCNPPRCIHSLVLTLTGLPDSSAAVCWGLDMLLQSHYLCPYSTHFLSSSEQGSRTYNDQQNLADQLMCYVCVFGMQACWDCSGAISPQPLAVVPDSPSRGG